VLFITNTPDAMIMHNAYDHIPFMIMQKGTEGHKTASNTALPYPCNFFGHFAYNTVYCHTILISTSGKGDHPPSHWYLCRNLL
jgi:hypothetical protein